MKDDSERLRHLLEAIDRIERYVARGRSAFDTDELVQTWIVYHLQIVGEAARKTSKELKKDHPEVPWAEVIATRNVLVHDYVEIDLPSVWDIVTRDLPALRQQIEALLKILSDH